MNIENLIKYMQKPNFFGKDVRSVKIIETHISYVFLTGNFAYKIKKPVNYGFLDFSTLEKRQFYCKKELKLNKRLCPEMYIEILPITKINNKIDLNGVGKVIEYTLKMKEFPQELIMNNLLKKEKINKNDIKKINKILINFYKSTKTTDEINIYGKIENIKKNIIENFDQTKPFIDKSISKDKYDYIKSVVNLFFKKREYVFDNRILNKHIHDCHGDLHTGNIIISKNDINIFDCIEFNKRFRYCDTASDIGFLSMDLDYQNHPYISSFLIKDYIKKSNDRNILQILNFYKSYRAYVRGKVISFNFNNINKKEYNVFLNKAIKYFDLSKYYTSLIEIELKRKKPLLIIVCGLTGTGKSTLSMKLSIDYNAKVINTDVIRKKSSKINIYEKHHNEINTGLYSYKKILDTYKKVIEHARQFLKNNENVIIDATFQKNEYREMVDEIAKEFSIKPFFIQCTAPDYIIKNWLKDRQKTRTVSDGRWDIYIYQKKIFESFLLKNNHLIIDMSKDSFEERKEFFNSILLKVKEASM